MNTRYVSKDTTVGNFKKSGRRSLFSIFGNCPKICCASLWTWDIGNISYASGHSRFDVLPCRYLPELKNEVPSLAGPLLNFWEFSDDLLDFSMDLKNIKRHLKALSSKCFITADAKLTTPRLLYQWQKRQIQKNACVNLYKNIYYSKFLSNYLRQNTQNRNWNKGRTTSVVLTIENEAHKNLQPLARDKTSIGRVGYHSRKYDRNTYKCWKVKPITNITTWNYYPSKGHHSRVSCSGRRRWVWTNTNALQAGTYVEKSSKNRTAGNSTWRRLTRHHLLFPLVFGVKKK